MTGLAAVRKVTSLL